MKIGQAIFAAASFIDRVAATVEPTVSGVGRYAIFRCRDCCINLIDRDPELEFDVAGNFIANVCERMRR